MKWVKNEMVEREGKRAVLQSTEQRQHKEDPERAVGPRGVTSW